VAALGYVITARDEAHVARLVKAPIDLVCPGRLVGLMAGTQTINVSLKRGGQPLNLQAKLVVGADGGNSSVRKLLEINQHIVEYGQTALVTTVKTSIPHKNTAYERFTRSGRWPYCLLIRIIAPWFGHAAPKMQMR
jgi:2-octaprenyl-6-methoxyphenol hydroxylase